MSERSIQYWYTDRNKQPDEEDEKADDDVTAIHGRLPFRYLYVSSVVFRFLPVELVHIDLFHRTVFGTPERQPVQLKGRENEECFTVVARRKPIGFSRGMKPTTGNLSTFVATAGYSTPRCLTFI
jgi:hypothetical protein